MENTKANVANKKAWQKPNFWILDSCVEGGADAHVKESTCLTHTSSNAGRAGQPNRSVFKASDPNDTASNWTAAHS
ncbi:MAG: hypothetical protein JWQ79_2494 [Mucilaginibacter sp.]|jgi:hypothetical protein|nr:hypothetical protein [Mucilaginibacter sp.]